MPTNINNLTSKAWELPTYNTEPKVIKIDLPKRTRIIPMLNCDHVTYSSGDFEPMRRPDTAPERNNCSHNHNDRNRR